MNIHDVWFIRGLWAACIAALLFGGCGKPPPPPLSQEETDQLELKIDEGTHAAPETVVPGDGAKPEPPSSAQPADADSPGQAGSKP